MILYWLQLRDCSSTFKRAEELREYMRSWFYEREKDRPEHVGCPEPTIIWDDDDAAPTAVTIQGTSVPPDAQEFLAPLQRLLSPGEYLVFIVMVDQGRCDKAGVHYWMAMHDKWASLSGDDLLARLTAWIKETE